VTGRLRPYKTWKPIEQATMSYGYGLSVSLFQLARAYTVFARDGDLAPITMVKHVEPPGPLVTTRAAPSLVGSAVASEPPPLEHVAGVRVLSVKTARAVREMLHMVTGEGGTAPKAQALGYSVGGKTGTAYKQEGGSYATKKYRAWFVGIAPISNPRIVVAVMVDEPSAGKYFGGDVAAPVFSQVVQQSLRMLGVPPDLDVKTQIVAHDVLAEEESF
jgi:cell division protein FtsI (penicillin-binding protein 3)